MSDDSLSDLTRLTQEAYDDANMMSDTDQRLREIQERVEKATPGPWMLDGTDNDGMRYVEDKEHAIGQFWQEEDAALIANAPADLAWLLEQLAALRLVEAQAKQMRATLIAIEPRCEYVGCEKPGPHVTHSIGGTASAEKCEHLGATAIIIDS